MNRAREADTLQRWLTSITGVDVELRWHPSDGVGAGRRQWHVVWTDGPSPATMSDLIKQACRDFRELTPNALTYHRIIRPRTVALSMIRNARHGRPALGVYRTVRLLAAQLRKTDYPERGTTDELALADTLTRLSHHRETDMPAILARCGLAGLRSQSTKPDNVVPLRPLSNT